ncbi:granzyme B-like [Pholidichthys leucotaenia]
MNALHAFLFFGLLAFRQKALGSEIINGGRAPENSLLFMASVQDYNGHDCGGFLVSENFVLTAAHCNKNKKLSKVVLGTHNLRYSSRTESGIVKKCPHPNYKGIGDGHDIMLLKLTKKIQPSNTIKYALLPSPGAHVKENEKCLVAGWGMLKSKGHTVNELRQVEVSVMSQQKCKEKYPSLRYGTFCAGGFGTKKGFCQGDSGGPLVCNGKAVGIVSFTGRWCDYDSPNIYVDISKQLPWINKILKANDC